MEIMNRQNVLRSLDDRHLRGSTASDLKLPPESDADSIADYADGENAGKNFVCHVDFVIACNINITDVFKTRRV